MDLPRTRGIVTFGAAMSQEQSSALIALNHHALCLNHRLISGDTDKALEALAELRLATADLKRLLADG